MTRDAPAGGAVVVVTGAASGIGRATAARLAASGLRVAGVDRDNCSGVDGAAFAHRADLADGEACVAAVQAVREHFGALDALVHAAGVTRDAVLWKLAPADWDLVLSTNLTSAFHLSRAAIPFLREREGGSIVFVSSINGERGKFGQGAYAASKAGLNGLGRTLAREVGRFGIRVNVVAPGMVTTPMTMALPEEVRRAAQAETCLDRLGEPEDVAAVIDFLVSPAARHVTAQVMRVDGGQA